MNFAEKNKTIFQSTALYIYNAYIYHGNDSIWK